MGFIKILNGDKNFIELGNLDAIRDWGYAKEYVQLMWKMLQNKKPSDYVISTGKCYSIRDFINECTKYLKIDAKWIGKGLKEKLINKKNNKILIKINKKFFRAAEVNFLRGNSNKAKKDLNWKPRTNLKQLVKIMIDEETKYYKKY